MTAKDSVWGRDGEFPMIENADAAGGCPFTPTDDVAGVTPIRVEELEGPLAADAEFGLWTVVDRPRGISFV